MDAPWIRDDAVPLQQATLPRPRRDVLPPGSPASYITIRGIIVCAKETMEKRPKESDWKTFRKRVPEWRERYLRKKNKEIIGLLLAENKTPTEQFWDAHDRMKKEARILVDCLDGHSRSKMFWALVSMHHHGLIYDADLEEFSEQLQEEMLRATQEL